MALPAPPYTTPLHHPLRRSKSSPEFPTFPINRTSQAEPAPEGRAESPHTPENKPIPSYTTSPPAPRKEAAEPGKFPKSPVTPTICRCACHSDKEVEEKEEEGGVWEECRAQQDVGDEMTEERGAGNGDVVGDEDGKLRWKLGGNLLFAKHEFPHSALQKRPFAAFDSDSDCDSDSEYDPPRPHVSTRFAEKRVSAPRKLLQDGFDDKSALDIKEEDGKEEPNFGEATVFGKGIAPPPPTPMIKDFQTRQYAIDMQELFERFDQRTITPPVIDSEDEKGI